MGGRFAIFLVAFAALVVWWKHVPDAGGRFDAMRIDAEAGAIDLDGVTYTAKFGESVRIEGDVRLIQTVAHDPAPIITHEVVLTTGEFSDPEFTKIENWGPGTVRIESARQPEGSLTMIHVIPANAAVVEALDQLSEGRPAEIQGRKVVGSRIENSNGGWIGLTHAGHEILLADRVTPR